MLRFKIIAELSNKYATDPSHTAILHLFNPSQEIALADGSINFQPKAMVKLMESQLWDFPLFYADKGDYLLTPDNSIVDLNGNRIDGPTTDLIPFPWGWNKVVRRRFISCGISDKFMPTDYQIEQLRELASRKFCVQYIRNLLKHIDSHKYENRLVGYDMNFSSHNELNGLPDKSLIFKQLWSSSGRGNFVASIKDSSTAIRLSGFIRNQGGFVYDFFYTKILDFAMEFYVFLDGSVNFVGYSVFKTDNKGKYEGNFLIGQKDMENMILDKLQDPTLLLTVKNAHLSLLKASLAGKYTGFVGIDMMIVDNDGIMACHPCVEINLRMNMGVVAMKTYRRLRWLDDGDGNIGDSEDGAWWRSSIRDSEDDKRERGFHTDLKSCLISIKYS